MKKLLNHKACTIALFAIVVFGTAALSSVLSSGTVSLTVDYNSESECQNVEISILTEQGEPQEGVVRVEKTVQTPGQTRVVFRAVGNGKAELKVRCDLLRNGVVVGRSAGRTVQVKYNHMIFTGEKFLNFSGYSANYFAVTVFAALMTAYYFYLFRKTLREARYSYTAISSASTMLFFLGIFLIYNAASLVAVTRYHEMNTEMMALVTGRITTAFTALLFPPFVVFALAMTASNIVLMRREGVKPLNALGIAVSVFMLLGTGTVIALFVLSTRTDDLAISIANAVGGALFVLLSSILMGTILCGILAARYVPELDKDFVLILGCRVRKDGTLPPLLKGRADRAIRFYREQLNKTGKAPMLIPSGGKGADEPISEAEAMAVYLKEQGIPEENILAEKNSASTLENMKFSRKLIESIRPDAKTAFCTTNYHVFRSGLLAEAAGLSAEGMGSRTRWYYWPNAFMREVAGLFAAHPKKQTAIIVLLSVAAGLCAFGYSLIA